MDKPAKVKRALIEALGLNPNLPIMATVVSVEITTCTVMLASKLVLSDVRLCATINEAVDVLILKPQIGSEVMLLSQTGTLEGLTVIKIDSLESIEYKKAGFQFSIHGTDGKLTLKKGSVNFGALMDNLIDTISAAVIVTPNGPGSIDPATQAQLNNIKIAFNSILNVN